MPLSEGFGAGGHPLTSLPSLPGRQALTRTGLSPASLSNYHGTLRLGLKNEIEIKPLRVWSDNSVYGALIIGYLAQLIISLIRYEIEELKHTSTKFIKKSLMNLTVTVEYGRNPRKKYIYSNFDPINEVILAQNRVII